MIQIRQGVFETNSSSTHAISICTKEDWEALQSGETWVSKESLTVLPKEAAIQANTELIKNCPSYWSPQEWLDWNGYVDWDTFYNNIDMEFSVKESNVGGVDVVAWGYYGYDN